MFISRRRGLDSASIRYANVKIGVEEIAYDVVEWIQLVRIGQ
jgi:hypothetical protein